MVNDRCVLIKVYVTQKLIDLERQRPSKTGKPLIQREETTWNEKENEEIHHYGEAPDTTRRNDLERKRKRRDTRLIKTN